MSKNNEKFLRVTIGNRKGMENKRKVVRGFAIVIVKAKGAVP